MDWWKETEKAQMQKKYTRRYEDKRPLLQLGLWWGGEKTEASVGGNLPRARCLPRGPCFSGFPNVREIQGRLWAQSALYPDLMMPFIWFLNIGFAVFWAATGVC